MRKFYSLVLMAAGLLIGTNVWAGNISTNGVADNEALQAAIYEGGTITLQTDLILDPDGKPIWIGPADGSEAGDAPSVIIDLNGHVISCAGPGADVAVFMFALGKGTLEFAGEGSILLTGSAHKDSNVFSVFGTYNKTSNYSHLIIGENVTVSTVNGSVISILEKSVQEGQYRQVAYRKIFPDETVAGFVTDYKAGLYGFAFGVVVDVKGTLQVVQSSGNTKTYGIKANGLIARPENGTAKRSMSTANAYEAGMAAVTVDASFEDVVPYVHVWPSAHITSSGSIQESAAIYASGYAHWLIEGECMGNIGASISSGQVEFNDAKIGSNSTATSHIVPSGNNSVSGTAAGIVVNSRNQNAGGVNVVISGETEVTTTSVGVAIEERVNTSNSQPKVESIVIESGSIQGGDAGAVYVTSPAQTTIYGGHVEGSITVNEGQISDLIPQGASGDTYTYDENTKTYSFNAAFHVTLNAAGLATFSAANAVKLPTGLVAYRADHMEGDNLVIDAIGGAGAVLPADAGVLLYGDANADFVLYANSGDDAVTIGGNLMRPATAFENAYAQNEDIYILHGEELYLYTGDEFKPNKAFFSLPSINSGAAPQRIRMIVNEAQGVENVEVEAVKAEKFYENGQLFIRRGAEVYNVQGQLVK